MRTLTFVVLAALSATAFADIRAPKPIEFISGADAYNQENTVSRQYSNVQDVMANPTLFDRTVDFPTQIVRIGGPIANSKRNCDEVIQDIDAVFSSKLDPERFYYNIYINCGYDPKTEVATSFHINSYFDPMTNDAIEYLKIYLKENNGKVLYGITLDIESANGLAVSLNIDAGVSQDEYGSVLLRYQHDNASLYFSSNYEMLKLFVADLYKNLYSNDPKVVLPFMNRWLFSYAGMVYDRALRLSNYVLVMPERMFLMSKAPIIYTSPLRMYFAHKCETYPNKKCL